VTAEGSTGAPLRIQRKRTKGWRMPEGAVYVGRPSRWGNPFKVGDRHPLRGRTLACWCRLDQPCHGDFLLLWANR
jgi:hypothetical protein